MRVAALPSIALVITAACSGVLGLDAPTLDPCAASACADGSTADASPGADAADGFGGADAKSDHDSVAGIVCGGGSFGETGCEGQTPVCCQTTDDAGTPSYTCGATSGGCAGYPIACATNNDCPGNDVCCRQSSSIKCTGSSSCSNGSLVCDPNGSSDQCPTGWSCSGVATLDGVASPYSVCAQ